MPDKIITPEELRQHFLNKAAPLVDEYVEASLGTGELSSIDGECRTEVWDLLKQIMLKASDRIEIEANTAKGIIEAASQGQCSITEAKQLLDMYKTVAEVDSLKNGGTGIPGACVPLIEFRVRKEEK